MGELSDGSFQDVTQTATWSSNDPTVVTVGNTPGPEKGSFLTVGVGSTEIAATLATVTSAEPLAVNDAGLVEIDVVNSDGSGPPATLPSGIDYRFATRGRFELGTDRCTYDLTEAVSWESSQPLVATVHQAPGSRGTVTTLQAGMTTLWVDSQGVTGFLDLGVIDDTFSIEVRSASGADPPASLAVGQTHPYRAVLVFDTSAVEIDMTDVAAWASTDEDVVQVDNAEDRGLAEALAVGQSTLTATYGLLMDTLDVTVELDCIETMTLTVNGSVGALDYPRDVPLLVQATGLSWGGDSISLTIGSDVFVESSDPTRLGDPDVAGYTYTVPAGQNGSAGPVTLTGTVPMFPAGIGCSTLGEDVVDTLDLFVTLANLLSMTIFPQTPSVPVGLSRPLQAVGTYDDASQFIITRRASWQSLDPGVATVVSGPDDLFSGSAQGVSPGTASIVAQQGTVMGAVTLEVTDAVPVDITAQAYLSEPTASGCRAIGDPGSYTATDSVASHPAGGLETYVRAEALLSDGSTEDVTEMVTWALAAPAAGATIFQDGRLMTGPPSGSPANLHVVATLQGLSDSIDIVQVPDAITELVLNRGTDEDDPLNLLVGSTGQLQAHGSFGGTWYCVTPDAAFLSNDPAVCEAGNAPGSEGLVSATSPGMTTVDAELDGAVDDIEVLVSSP